MNILIDINHPAHVHLLRNAYKVLVEKGHEVLVVVKEIPSAMKLLELYGIPYINIGKKDDAIGKKGMDQLVFDRRLLKLVHHHHIDLGIGSSINIAHVSKLCKMKSIVLDDDDDEAEPLFVKFGHPFADTILTPSAIKRKWHIMTLAPRACPSKTSADLWNACKPVEKSSSPPSGTLTKNSSHFN